MSLYRAGCQAELGAIRVGATKKAGLETELLVIGGIGLAVFVVLPRMRGTSVTQAWKDAK